VLILLYAQMTLTSNIVGVICLMLSRQLAQLTFKYILAAAGETTLNLLFGHFLGEPKLNLVKVLLPLFRLKDRHLGSGDALYIIIFGEVNIL
jgi:hypothetical protein